MKISLPKSISIIGSDGYFDGGTTFLYAKTEQDSELEIKITQHTFSVEFPFLYRWIGRFIPLVNKPGRLYFDGHLIRPKSKKERRIIQLLESATIIDANNIEHDYSDTAEDVAKCLAYLRSPDYLRIARTGICP